MLASVVATTKHTCHLATDPQPGIHSVRGTHMSDETTVSVRRDLAASAYVALIAGAVVLIAGAVVGAVADAVAGAHASRISILFSRERLSSMTLSFRCSRGKFLRFAATNTTDKVSALKNSLSSPSIDPSMLANSLVLWLGPRRSVSLERCLS